MSDKVVKLYTRKTASDPDAVLDMAKGAFKNVCIFGLNSDGSLEARATTGLTRAEIVFYLEELKLMLLSAPVDEDDDDD